MEKTFITGGTGFLGRHLVRRLIAEGHQVTIMAQKPNPEIFPTSFNISWVEGNVLDPISKLSSLIQGHQNVYHLAGLVGYKKSLYHKMFEVNVEGTRRVLTASIEKKVEHFFFASSVAAIGASFSSSEILNEESPYKLEQFNFGYFESKRKAEALVIDLSEQHEIKTFILNPSTIYGSEDFLKDSRKTQLKVAQGKFPFIPPGGVNVVHVDDVVEAFLKVKSKGKKNRRYIIANQNVTIETLFEWIAEEAQVKAPQFYIPKWILYGLGVAGDVLNFMNINTELSLENARVSSLYHWFSNERAKKELDMNFKDSRLAVRESVRSFLKSINSNHRR